MKKNNMRTSPPVLRSIQREGRGHGTWSLFVLKLEAAFEVDLLKIYYVCRILRISHQDE